MVNITVMLLKPLCDHTSFMSRDMVTQVTTAIRKTDALWDESEGPMLVVINICGMIAICSFARFVSALLHQIFCHIFHLNT